MAFDLRTCDGSCTGCVRGYIKKHRLIKGNKFEVACEGIPKEYIPANVLASIPHDPSLSLAMLDPVVWAARFLDWHCLDPDGTIWKRKTADGTLKGLPAYKDTPEDRERIKNSKSIFHRPYQVEMLRCTAKRKVFRIGRQCLAETAQIQLSDGTVKSIKDIKIGDLLPSLNIETNQIEKDVVIDAWQSGIKKIYEIKTQFGHKIECSITHPFWSARGDCDRKNNRSVDKLKHLWMSIEDGLKIGDKIAVPQSIITFGDQPLPKFVPELLGYFIADGSASVNQSCKFTNNAQEYLDEFELCCLGLGSKVKKYPKGNGYDLIISNGHGKPNPVRELLSTYGLVGITGPKKLIPSVLFNAPRSQIKVFLERFWAADGYVYTGKRTGRDTFKVEIGNLQENRELLEQVQILLWRFGIHGYIKPDGNSWRLVVSNKSSVINFLEYLGDIPGKGAAVNRAREAILRTTDKYLHTEGEILWDHITSIKEIGEQQTYDITVEKNHNFLANGIITKNSGKTESICVAILFHIFTHERFSVEVIAPYQAHIDLIFTRLVELIKDSSHYQNSIKRHVKAPNYTLELHNGSTVRGFTAGSRSGGDAGASRGQHANMLVFDEADMLNAADIDAALAVIINYPDAQVWMSSTPTGKRQKFYDSCWDPAIKEFHYPSSVNPNWTEALEKYYKKNLTSLGYKHEILADFGEQEEGVYQIKFVEQAQAYYEYETQKWHPGWVYNIGVDWNDVVIGTSIKVVGWNPGDGCFYIVDKQIVSKEGWNQLAAVQKVMELNRTWRPTWIYVDHGFGHMQVEVLHQFGRDAQMDPKRGPSHVDARLSRIVKPYEFGGSVEVRDPFTKQFVKKPAKAFMVESSVRLFEAGTLKYPASDKELTRSFLGYRIKRVNQSGTPIYEQSDEQAGDHFLDALNLALVAFVLEESEFGKVKYDPYVTFSTSRLNAVADNLNREPANREQSQPEVGRSDFTKHSPNKRMPAARVNRNTGADGIWSWPGFMRDLPAPPARRPRTPFTGRATIPPKRKTF